VPTEQLALEVTDFDFSARRGSNGCDHKRATNLRNPKPESAKSYEQSGDCRGPADQAHQKLR
jgi:hypothetical protein